MTIELGKTLRYLQDDGASAAEGLATDELLLDQQGKAQLFGQQGKAQLFEQHAESPLCEQQGKPASIEEPGGSPSLPTLRLYSYRSHCALIGRFQDLDAEVDVAECARRGIELSRRPTGGGAILMGADQLGVALAAPGAGLASRAILARAAQGVLAGLEALGISAELRGKNDLAVAGRKIAGLGVCRHESGAFLFHSSVLLDLDVELMLRVLRIPLEKLRGEAVRIVEQRMTTVRRELCRPVAMSELRAAVREGYQRVFGVRAEPAALDAAERQATWRLARDKYRAEEWIRERSGGAGPAGVGHAKAPGGLIRAQVAVAGGAIQAVYLSADFLDAAPNFLAEIEAHLRWTRATAESVAPIVARIFRAAPGAPDGVEAEHVTQAICRAIDSAIRPDTERGYACFVGPLGGER